MSNYVITYPLLTKKQDEDKLNKILSMLTLHYNNVQRKMLNKWNFITSTRLYKDYASNNFKGLGKEERDTKRKEWNELLKANKFTKFGVFSYFKIQKGYKANGLNSQNLRYLAMNLWSAWEKKLKNNTIFINTKNEVNTIGFLPTNGKFSGLNLNIANHIVELPKYGITMPYVFQGNDYEIFAENSKMVVMAITHKKIRGVYKFFLQITYEGIPYNKGRHMGNGKVGIDTSQQKMYALYENGEAVTYNISVSKDDAKIARLMRKLDRQRRANNPSAYDGEGRCIVKKGEYEWVVSKNEQKTINLLAELSRKNAVNRKILHNNLANNIISKANEIKLEKIQFASLARRSKGTKKNSKGKNLSNKRFGKSISSGAPSQFITILRNKTACWEGCEFTEVKPQYACTQFDHTNGEYTKRSIKERSITLGDGNKVHRDFHAAMNVMFCNTTEKEKTEKSFDVDNMQSWYKQHKASIEISQG